MAKLLMITGLGSAKDLASDRQGAFYNTLEEFHKYWDRIDIMAPKIQNSKSQTIVLFGNVFIHISPWPLVFHPIWFIKKGIEIYKEQKFNLMTVQEFPPFYNGLGARFLWQKIKVPYILEIHHISGYPKSATFKERIYSKKIIWKLYWKFIGFKASAVRVVNQKQTPEFLKKVGVPENKIKYIPSMYVDLDIFQPTESVKIYDIIFIGRLAENKGINLLLKAVKNLNLKVIIIGDGPLKENLKFKIKNLKLQDNVLLYGWAKNQNEIAELLHKSKILLMPSYNEGGPRVVLEAMACGVPVLATRVGLVPDLADKNAVKIIDWNAEDIAGKVKELLGNESERNRLSQTGPEIAKQFEKKAMIKNYAEQIKQLI